MPAGSVSVAANGTVTKSGLAEDIYDARAAAMANFKPPGTIPAGPLGYPIKNGLAQDATALAAAIYPAIEEAAGGVLAAGLVVADATGAARTGWLLCDGAAVSRATYAPLFAAIGTAHGPGDGSTTFNVPTIPALIVGVVYVIKT